MKNILSLTLSFLLILLSSCVDTSADKNLPGGNTDVNGNGDDNDNDNTGDETTIVDGFNFSPATPNADQAVKITFKASQSSPLYAYSGECYLHTGVITDGAWFYVPAEWNENLEKCKFELVEPNVWQIELGPSMREWYGSEQTAIEQIGVIIRSKDGTLKGVENDTFKTVTDNKYHGFQPADKKLQSVDATWHDGINILSDSSVALVLRDKDNTGKSHDYAHVVGDFNDWTLANDSSSQMYRDDAEGVWWIRLDGLNHTAEHTFQYYIGSKGDSAKRMADPYSTKILDPDNDKYIPSTTYSENLTYPDGAIGQVSAFTIAGDGYTWQNDVVEIKDKGDLIIYELLLRDFTTSGDIAGALERLDYIESLGVNAIELMPVQEFDGNDSWGYNPAFYFALDKAYGTSTDYKSFVDECHARGIAVILDVVYNHSSGSHPFAKLYWDREKNKTAKNNPYYNVDAPHPYSVFHDFNHSSPLVRDYVKRSLKYMLEEYRFDGFRFDLTKGFTQNKSTEATASAYDASRIEILSDYYSSITAVRSDAVMICEHFCDYGEEAELAKMGMMMWRNSNFSYAQAAMGWSSDSSFEGIYVDFMPDGWVGFMESHDEERLAYKQRKWGDASLKGNTQTSMNQRAVCAAFSMLVPGPKMIWQFGEMGYDYSINSNQAGTAESEEYRTARKPIRWDYLDDKERSSLVEDYSRLLALRTAYPDIFADDSLVSWSVATSDWVNGRYMRLSDGVNTVVVMGNFTADAIESTATLDSGNVWYDFDTCEKYTQSSVNLAPCSYKVFTNFAIN